jgi:hypothetical protein
MMPNARWPTDTEITSPCARGVYQLLDDPYLIRWYAQNNDEPHPKITPIPIGLNRFEHAEAMHEALKYKASS